MEACGIDRIVGCTDGVKHGYVEGWAWCPDRPLEAVVVQMLVNGELVAESTACIPRADLQAAGVGSGQHAFMIPLETEGTSRGPLHVVVRVKGGAVLPGGEFDIETNGLGAADTANRQALTDLEQVFGPLSGAGSAAPRAVPPRVRAQNFIVHNPNLGVGPAARPGLAADSDGAVVRAFREVLRRLGTVHQVRDPATEVDAIHDSCLARGESCLFLCFAPPHVAPLGLRCPTVPVLAWEFATIPTGGWSSRAQDDWSLVLRQFGRAITHSEFAVRAIRATMGASFPVACVPVPAWDRLSGFRARYADVAPGAGATLRLDGLVWDSRGVNLSVDMRIPPLPVAVPRPQAPARRGAALALAMASARAASARARMASVVVSPVVEAPPVPAEPSVVEEAPRVVAAAPARADRQPRPGPLRRTAFHAREWYRDVLRDMLPRRLVVSISKVGRAVASRRDPGATAETAATADAAAQAAIAPPEPVAPAAHVDDAACVADAAGQDEAAPGDAMPAGARYLPVGDPSQPESTVPPPKYLPAPDDAPLPEAYPAAIHPPEVIPSAEPRVQSVVLDGVVFAAVLSPRDGSQNWQDLVSAFTAAFRDTAEATLVLDMVGNDPSYWWWELHGIVKAMPPFACRVVVLDGALDEAAYHTLIGATHFAVNASRAAGQCLQLTEFMSAGRPAIAPLHTAMRDYITADNAVIAASSPEFCALPQDTRNLLASTRHRVEWSSLRDAFGHAFRIASGEPDRYAAMGDAAAASMRAYCADDTVGPRLAAFLGIGDDAVRGAGWRPVARAAAEPLLDCAVGAPANHAAAPHTEPAAAHT
jgi:hypothetical protein